MKKIRSSSIKEKAPRRRDNVPFSKKMMTTQRTISSDFDELIRKVQARQAELEKQFQRFCKAQMEIETLAENAPEGIFRLDRDLRHLFVNQALANCLSKPKEILLGKTVTEWGLPLESFEFLEKMVKEVLANQIPKELELKFTGPEGDRCFQTRLTPEFNINGDVESILGIARDITELRQKQEALRSEHAFREAIEKSILLGIVAMDREGRQIYVNSAFCKMVGWRKEDLLGAKPPFLYWPPEEREALSQAFQKFLRDGENGGHEFRFQRRTGERFEALAFFSPLRDGRGERIGWVGSIGDITDHKRKEEEIRRLNVEFEERVRQRTVELEVKNRELENINKELEAFCYSASHDLRAPLSVINGFSRKLIKRYANKLDTKGNQYLQHLYQASQHMMFLIEDLLRLSKVTQSGMRLKIVDLSELVKSVANELQKVNPERHVEWDIQEGLVARGDPALLKIALENLLGNAWKFTNKQAKAMIEFGLVGAEENPTYFIRDNGCGFDRAFSDKLFRPFQRLHSPDEFPGTGIGLTTVQRIIQRHGGRIWAESIIRKGATFFFTLPF